MFMSLEEEWHTLCRHMNMLVELGVDGLTPTPVTDMCTFLCKYAPLSSSSVLLSPDCRQRFNAYWSFVGWFSRVLEEQVDSCTTCGDDLFVTDHKEAEIVCTSCGTVSAFTSDVVPPAVTVHRYTRAGHFKSRYLDRLKGLTHYYPLLLSHFTSYCRAFEEVKQSIGRKNFPHYGYVLREMCSDLGLHHLLKDIPQLKLKQTLTKLEVDVNIMKERIKCF